MTQAIPHQEIYRGVGIEEDQSPARVETVRAAIDAVHAISDLVQLAQIAGDITRPPEARLFAAAKCEAALQIAADQRIVRPIVDIDRVRSSVAGLGSLYWRDPELHCSLLCALPAAGHGPARREAAWA